MAERCVETFNCKKNKKIKNIKKKGTNKTKRCEGEFCMSIVTERDENQWISNRLDKNNVF
jgi:hypothetical protein